jgi:hypothetical protein
MEPLGAFKDFEVSRSIMAARWKQGLSNVLIALQASPWLAPMPKELGVRVFDVMHDILSGGSEAVLNPTVSNTSTYNHETNWEDFDDIDDWHGAAGSIAWREIQLRD